MTVMEKLINLSFPLIPLNKQNKPGDPAIDCQNKVRKITLFLLIYLNLSLWRYPGITYAHHSSRPREIILFMYIVMIEIISINLQV